jgi:imidazole glycerol phosphate synthase glutamine amidotransferase subunit
MRKVRVIARLDVKGPNVIKGIQFECLRVMGKPGALAEEYYMQGADEIIYIDIVASLYQRSNLLDIVRRASEKIFIPITAGGGVRTIEDIRDLLKAGADKVAINTAATKNPNLITEAARAFGSQCIVGSIEAKKIGENKWEAYTDNGRQSTGLDVLEWAKKLEQLGAGEILLTAVDLDGTKKGLDLELIQKVSALVSIPVIASGGVGKIDDIATCFKTAQVDGVAIGTLLHYHKTGISEIKEVLGKEGIDVRNEKDAKKLDLKSEHGDNSSDYNRYTLRHLSEEVEGVGPSSFSREENTGDYDIGIINYKLNNVESVARAFESLGKRVEIIETSEGIKASKALVLPGVGAYEQGMLALEKMGLIWAIKEKVQMGTPLLGICLGMQMLFTESEEFGLHQGLDLIKGRVVPFKEPSEVNVRGYKVPHMGWNEITVQSDKLATIMKNTKTGDNMYFAHSYYPVVKNKEEVVATSEYGGQVFCSAVQAGNISGVQFHPEKSGKAGLALLKAFCEINNI